jgi:hypothetical protein
MYEARHGIESAPHGRTAGNAWFARYFGVKLQRASKVIRSLAAKGFIKTTEEWNGKKVIRRTLEIIDEDINKTLMGISTKWITGISTKWVKIN